MLLSDTSIMFRSFELEPLLRWQYAANHAAAGSSDNLEVPVVAELSMDVRVRPPTCAVPRAAARRGASRRLSVLCFVTSLSTSA